MSDAGSRWICFSAESKILSNDKFFYDVRRKRQVEGNCELVTLTDWEYTFNTIFLKELLLGFFQSEIRLVSEEMRVPREISYCKGDFRITYLNCDVEVSLN